MTSAIVDAAQNAIAGTQDSAKRHRKPHQSCEKSRGEQHVLHRRGHKPGSKGKPRSFNSATIASAEFHRAPISTILQYPIAEGIPMAIAVAATVTFQSSVPIANRPSSASLVAAGAFANCLKRHNFNAEGDLILQKIEALQHEIDTIRRFAGI